MQKQGMPGVAEVCACQKMKPVRAEAQDSRTRPSLPFFCSSEIPKCQSCRQHKCLGTRQEIDEGSASITYYGAFLDLLPHAQGINNFIIQGNCIKPHLPPARRIRLYRNLLLRASRTGSHAVLFLSVLVGVQTPLAYRSTLPAPRHCKINTAAPST